MLLVVASYSTNIKRNPLEEKKNSCSLWAVIYLSVWTPFTIRSYHRELLADARADSMIANLFNVLPTTHVSAYGTRTTSYAVLAACSVVNLYRTYNKLLFA